MLNAALKDAVFRVLPRVQTPAQYLGGELNAVRRTTARSAASCAWLPGHLHAGHEPSRLAGALHDHERRPAVGLRAGLHPLARLRGRTPRPQTAAVQPGDVHAAARVRPARLQPAVRGLLHQRPDDARPGRHPAAREDRRVTGPAGHRRRPRGAEPGVARPVRRPVRHRRRRGVPALGHGKVDDAQGTGAAGRRPVVPPPAGNDRRARRLARPGRTRRCSTSRSTTPTAPSPPSTAPRSDVPREIPPAPSRKDFDAIPLPTQPVVPFVQTPHDRIAIEIMRGCPHQCRFCQSTVIKRPLRVRSVETIVQAALESYRNTGTNEISLLSASRPATTRTSRSWSSGCTRCSPRSG